MLKRLSKRRETDLNRRAFLTVMKATGSEPPPAREKNPAAVALGKLGGAKGGRARAEKLTPKERADIAMKASRARWGPRT
jgi:hypothetical protein